MNYDANENNVSGDYRINNSRTIIKFFKNKTKIKGSTPDNKRRSFCSTKIFE